MPTVVFEKLLVSLQESINEGMASKLTPANFILHALKLLIP